MHRLSRRYPLLIHELSTILWIMRGLEDTRVCKGLRKTFRDRQRWVQALKRSTDPARRTLLFVCDREEAVDAKTGNESGPQRSQPVSCAQPKHSQRRAEDCDERVDGLEDLAAGHALKGER